MKVNSADPFSRGYAWARERMVQEQVIGRGIRDPRIIAAMRKIPRHMFVDPGLAERSYDEGALPIGRKQTISQPYIVAYMTETVGLKPQDRILEVGTGSGYQAAVLAELCTNVFSIETIRGLAVRARKLLDRLGYFNIAIHVGDGTLGWSEHAPYDAIICTAASPVTPKPLLGQLAVGGRLVIPVGDQESQELKLITRTRLGYKEENRTGCRFVKLRGKFGWHD